MLEVDPEVREVLTFWFGTLDAQGSSDAEHQRRWFGRDEHLDEQIRARFGPLLAAVRAGERDAWLVSARGRLAYVVVLDQLCRNAFRGTPDAFSGDRLALSAALEGIGLGVDRSLAWSERMFLYMPLMHAEDVAVQNRCVELFTSLCEEVDEPVRERIRPVVAFAREHRDVIGRFGRFPQRNAIMGRTSTHQEIAFMRRRSTP